MAILCNFFMEKLAYKTPQKAEIIWFATIFDENSSYAICIAGVALNLKYLMYFSFARIQFNGDLVTATPDVYQVALGPDAEFVLLASDGLWDYMKRSVLTIFNFSHDIICKFAYIISIVKIWGCAIPKAVLTFAKSSDAPSKCTLCFKGRTLLGHFWYLDHDRIISIISNFLISAKMQSILLGINSKNMVMFRWLVKHLHKQLW